MFTSWLRCAIIYNDIKRDNNKQLEISDKIGTHAGWYLNRCFYHLTCEIKVNFCAWVILCKFSVMSRIDDI